MLELVKLGCERGDRLLFAGLSRMLLPGQLVHIEGSNGSGKTSLLRILAGLSRDYRGDIMWQGSPLAAVYAHFRTSMFYCGHKAALKPELTPVENILWRGRLRNEDRSHKEIVTALQQVNLQGLDDMPCGYLSAGQQRRVVLADLSMSRVPLWILDEPFTTIDAHGVLWLESLLAGHVAQDGIVLITSHQPLSEVAGQVDSVHLEAFSQVNVPFGSEDEGMFL